jgi:hypothetical protein
LGTPLPAAKKKLSGQKYYEHNLVYRQCLFPEFTTDVAVDLGNGFANVKPTNKDDEIGTLTFSVPGFLFGDFLFDVQLDKFDPSCRR